MSQLRLESGQVAALLATAHVGGLAVLDASLDAIDPGAEVLIRE